MDKNKRYEAMKLFVQQSQQKKMQLAQKKLEEKREKLQKAQEKQQKERIQYSQKIPQSKEQTSHRQSRPGSAVSPRRQGPPVSVVSHENVDGQLSLWDDLYYEIEYDATPMPGVGKYVLKSQPLQTPERDEIRELFDRMREIARRNRIQVYGSSQFYNKKVQQERAGIFYKQGQYMKDFQDEFEEVVPYSEYFPCYQMMGYKQLRTYFTWRTKVRQGQVEDTSLSYAYLYLYELINNIGVADPQEGLEKLLEFWKVFRKYQPALDKHVPQWLKDYHIYYELEQSFQEFVTENELSEWYPELDRSDDVFAMYCGLSRYDIKKSKFYTQDRESLIQDCFRFTVLKLSEVMAEHGIRFEDFVYANPAVLALWMPFQDALFYPWMAQNARRVMVSPREVYLCSQSQWYYQVSMPLDGGRQFLGYLFKQMETVLRQTVKYKYKITADISVVPSGVLHKLEMEGISLERGLAEAVAEFYREATKTVVTVDKEALEKIRRESLQTQEKLLVPEEDGFGMGQVQMSLVQALDPEAESAENGMSETGDIPWSNPEADIPEKRGFTGLNPESESTGSYMAEKRNLSQSGLESEASEYGMIGKRTFSQSGLEEESAEAELVKANIQDHAASVPLDPWTELKAALSQTQLEALRLAVTGEANMKEFADANGVMLEVLADGINEKAVDLVGDSLLDEEFMVYDDYAEQIKEILGE